VLGLLWPNCVEAFLLLVVQRIIESHQCRADGLHSFKRGDKTQRHRLEAAGWRPRESVRRRTRGLEYGGGFLTGASHLVEQLLLVGVQANLAVDFRNWPGRDAGAGLRAQFLHGGITRAGHARIWRRRRVTVVRRRASLPPEHAV